MSERDAADRLLAEALGQGEAAAPDAEAAPEAPRGRKSWYFRPLQYDPAKEKWERQPYETNDAYAAFLLFRDMGPFGRSIRAVARQIGRTPTVPRRWHQQYLWEERAGAWDDDQRRQLDERNKDMQDRAVKNHFAISQKLINQVLNVLNNQAGQKIPDARILQQAAIALNQGIRHNRLALGLPTDITQNDQYLKGLLEEAMATQEQLRLILEEHLCDDCRQKIGGELRKIAEKQRAIRQRASI